MTRRYRHIATYSRRATGQGRPRPETVVNVRVTYLEYVALRRWARRLRRQRLLGRRPQVRRALIRILGRETIELIEAGRRDGETVSIRLNLERRLP